MEFCSSTILKKVRRSIANVTIGQLMGLKNEIGEKRLQMKKKKVFFHQDNAPCHKSLATMAKLNELSFELLPHPPYSPDLAPQ